MLDGTSKCAVIAFSGTFQQASVAQSTFREYVADFRVKLHWVGDERHTSNITFLANTALRLGADMGFDLLCYCEWPGVQTIPADMLRAFAEQELLANTSNIAFAFDFWVVLWSWAWKGLGFFEETFAPPRTIIATMLLYAEQFALKVREYTEVSLVVLRFACAVC
jgi:hypothetical protein